MWYELSNPDAVDSPALLVFPDRVQANIQLALSYVDGRAERLRPHIKTHKTSEVMRLMLEAGIRQIKCATPAEAEMAAQAGVPDILLAYQPVLPKARRLADLAARYSACRFSCLLDNEASAEMLGQVFAERGQTIAVWLDLNVGQHRTGLPPEKALALWRFCTQTPGLTPIGLHAYDGHLRDSDLTVRCQKADAAFESVERLAAQLTPRPAIVASGSPTFSCHARRPEVVCSPGTFIFWDWGYAQALPDMSFQWAAVLLTRVVSILDDQTLCLDLGHKAVASENPMDKRVHFLNAPEAQPCSHSEEHLTVTVPDTKRHRVGEVWYGIPYHICPTVALHETLVVVENQKAVGQWKVEARSRGGAVLDLRF